MSIVDVLKDLCCVYGPKCGLLPVVRKSVTRNFEGSEEITILVADLLFKYLFALTVTG